MNKTGVTILDAARMWVKEFNAIPISIVDKLLERNYDEIYELTPPAIGDYVEIWDGENDGKHGEIVKSNYDNESDLYVIELSDGEDLILSADEFSVQKPDRLPMWGMMWSFGDSCDEYWAEHHLQEMADCGFRIYEQEDYGLIFGIDGAGYDFYESHWIPLYKKRGLKWHDSNLEN